MVLRLWDLNISYAPNALTSLQGMEQWFQGA